MAGHALSQSYTVHLRPFSIGYSGECYLGARHLVNEDEGRQLIALVTKKEIKWAFFHIEEDKLSGLDKYPACFYKAAWLIIGDEVIRAVMEFFTTGRLLKQVNSTLLALILKVQALSTLADFRPISCCSVLYKVIMKIIVQRLRMIMDELISPSQNAFVPGRSIGDNILLAEELSPDIITTSLFELCLESGSS
ncbi:UNVERIFIED_CONTAM: hypothetical protein Sindi_2281700 [Sesamum indicum]